MSECFSFDLLTTAASTTQICVKLDLYVLQHDVRMIQRTSWASVETDLTVCTKCHMISVKHLFFAYFICELKVKNLRLLDLIVCNNKYPRGPAFPWVVLWDPHFEQLLSSDCHFFCCHTSVTCSHHFRLWPKGGSTAYGPSFHMLLASITSSSSFSASLLLTASHWSISS